MVDVIDYADVLATAIDAIAESGRIVSLAKNKRDVDPSNPMGAPIGADMTLDNILATFVYPTGLASLGSSMTNRKALRESDQIALIAGIDGQTLEYFDEMTDGSVVWSINVVDVLKPGDTVLLYYVGVTRK